MKLYVALLAAALGLSAADIGDAKTVYLLPMANGLDQFLAMRLTSGNVIQVVTDAKKADVILSDRIGAGLDQRLDDLYGNAPAASVASDDTKFVSVPVSRARGTVFLIDRKTRSVLWSAYQLPKNASPAEMNHIADKIAGKLGKDLKGK